MIIKTLYPDDFGSYHITLQGLTTNKYRSSLNISCITNNDALKISYSEHEAFMQKHIDDINNLYLFSEIRNSVASFSDFFVCMEDFRNISKGYIEDLRNDSSGYSSNRIGGFGALEKKGSKPMRVNFINKSKKNQDKLEYIETNKYNPFDPSMLSFVDIKKRFKYLIDLWGHTYSTKLYSFLHSKRVVFLVEPFPKYFKWENLLKPYKHYIPVEYDLSNLLSQFDYIESRPEIYSEIIENCNTLINQHIPPSFFIDKLKDEILNNAVYLNK